MGKRAEPLCVLVAMQPWKPLLNLPIYNNCLLPGKTFEKEIFFFWNFTSTFGVLLLPSAAGLGGRKAGFSTLLEAWIRKRTQPTLYRYPHIPFCVYFGRCWIGVSFRTTLSLRQPSWLHSEFYKSSFSGKLSKPQCPFESWCMTVQKTIQWHSIMQSIWKQLFPNITSQDLDL